MAAQAGDASLYACSRMAALSAELKAFCAGGNTDIWVKNLPPQNAGASGNSSQIRSIMSVI